MAKDKSKTGAKNKHLHARIAYLHQAATFLTNSPHAPVNIDQSTTQTSSQDGQPKAGPTRQEMSETITRSKPTLSPTPRESIIKPSSGGLPLHLTSHLAQVARKSQIRLQPEVKHSICKCCGTVQVEGDTCKKFTENLSKGAKKRHADVLVQECVVCGTKKRWPIGAMRQRKKGERESVKAYDQDGAPANPGATEGI